MSFVQDYNKCIYRLQKFFPTIEIVYCDWYITNGVSGKFMLHQSQLFLLKAVDQLQLATSPSWER
jgi:hypothetical protein